MTQDVDFYIAGTDRMAFRDELVAKGNIPGLPPEWTINHESRCGVTHMIRSPNQAPVIVKIDIIDERVVSRFNFLVIHFDQQLTVHKTGWKLSSDTFLAQVSEQSLPWGSRNDLICTKLKSAEERLSHGNTKAKQDVDDVQQLLYKLPGVLRDDREKKHCAYCLESAVQISTWDIRQWEERLGIKIPEL